ncbi:helix-turn-helix domain-containing protein [Pseudomonas abieticivorans]|uniref:helix-turn-helix domain-containing protein n=1 Tax=Pseudomonas abieticivorans TaxID=2931382 RepID=UPI0020C09892|nr:helix-turn-helix transcriptional regulator [Pseudomonas sp. PIA16]
MLLPVKTADSLGLIMRASRKAMSIRQDDAAGMIGISENFLSKVERGGEAVQWGKVFQALEALGLKLSVEVPDSVAQQTLLNMAKYDATKLTAKPAGPRF